MVGNGSGFDRALQRSLMQYRCFGCGGVLLVYHLCPCCLQLVHPGCECGARVVHQGTHSAVETQVIVRVQREEESQWI